MVKAATDIKTIVDAYVEELNKRLGVERVILSDVLTEGIDGKVGDVTFIVVSSAFEGLDALQRSKKLGLLGYKVSSLITAFAYTPAEFDGFFRGDSYDGVLAQFLNGSREVYRKHGAPLQTLLSEAGGQR